MGVLKLRDLQDIHNTKTKLPGDAGGRVNTYVNHQPYEYKGLVNMEECIGYGCCTSYSPKCNNKSKVYENSFIGLEHKYFPSSYKNMELVTEWVNFMNGLFPFFDIKIVTDFEQKLVNPEYWESKNLTFTFNRGFIYFVIKKDITKNQYFNLFQLSLLRYFVSNEYYFMIYDCLRLRKKKCFSKLSNWEIMNIARFGVQTNDQQFGNSMRNSWYNFAFLRDYRSPIFNNFYTTSLSSEAEVIKKLNDGTSQNVACKNNPLKLNVIYLMKLFQLGHHTKLYNLITNPKYEITDDPTSSKLSAFITKHIKGHTEFREINNLPFNQKEYEKTL